MTRIHGKIINGKGEAAFFTQLEWVKSQCLQKVGFTPYPGTLNIKIESAEIAIIKKLEKSGTLKLIPPDPQDCSAVIIPCTIELIKAAIVIPAEEVRVHGADVLEIFAPFQIRESLLKKEGDTISIRLTNVE